MIRVIAGTAYGHNVTKFFNKLRQREFDVLLHMQLAFRASLIARSVRARVKLGNAGALRLLDRQAEALALLDEAALVFSAAGQVAELARLVGEAGTRLATHTWRSAAAGNHGGWQITRSLFFLNVLTGSVGTEGGTHPNGWDKFIAHFPEMPPPNDVWSELLWPSEYPLTTNEMSILLPHLLKDGRGRLEVYFSRVYNPLWVNPDGFTWIDVLKDESKIGLHVALTPTWSESATFADYVLPMGHASERHDTMSFETHASKWLAFRQPVQRVAMEKRGIPYQDTRDTNPGEVWEENEFWFELSWQIDPDGSLGIRQWFESRERPGERMTQDEYYDTLFSRSVPGLPAAAEAQGLTPLQYMRTYGVFEVAKDQYRLDDGCGLSKENAISAEAASNLLDTATE